MLQVQSLMTKPASSASDTSRVAAILFSAVVVLAALAGCSSGSNSGSGSGSGSGSTPVAPTVASISPSSANVGSSATSVTVTGSNFTSSTTVQMGGQSEATSYVSATQLTATVPAAQLASAAVLAVTATNSAGTSSGTAVNFNVDNLVPTLTAASPATIGFGSAATVVTLTGTNFVSTTTIDVNGSARATTYVSATQVRVTLTAADLAALGTLSLTAVNPAPGGGTSAPLSLAVVNPAPGAAITLNPSTVLAASTPPVTITVTGSNFLSSSTVLVSGVARSTTYVSATQLTFQLSAADLAITGASATLPVTVSTPSPGGGTSNAATLTITTIALSGNVMAGNLPLVGSTVQLYAAGTTGNGSTATALLSPALTTDSNGLFTVPASSYNCPSPTSVLYVLATGGSVGTTGSSNSAIALMTSLGACSAVPGGASYVVNELTTVASGYAFAQFLSPGPQLGASATNTSGITLAAGTMANLVNPITGTAPGTTFPATGTAPIAELSSLANLVHACVASSGSSSGACSSLFSSVAAHTAPTNTLDAIADLAKSPASNAATIYGLSLASSVYGGGLAAAPSDWTMFVNYTGGGMSEPSAVSIDSKGNVWVPNYEAVTSLFTNTGAPVFANGLTGNGQGAAYGGAVDANDVMWVANEPAGGATNSVSLFTSTGAAVAGSPYTSGGLDFPIAIAVDATNVSWIVDYGDSSLTLLSNSGTPLSGPSGYNGLSSTGTSNFDFPVAVAVDSNRNGWVANQSSDTVTKVAPDGSSYTSYVTGDGPSGIAVDSANNVWVANYYGNSIGIVSSSGTVLSGSGITGGGIYHPQGIAVDGANNVWVANYRAPSLSELAGVGSAAGTGAALSPAAGLGGDASLLEAFALAIDASGNVWVTNFGTNTAGVYTLTEFVGLAAPVKTPLLGQVRVP